MQSEKFIQMSGFSICLLPLFSGKKMEWKIERPSQKHRHSIFFNLMENDILGDACEFKDRYYAILYFVVQYCLVFKGTINKFQGYWHCQSRCIVK